MIEERGAPETSRDNTCEQILPLEGRYCDAEAVYHDEESGKAYCEHHAHLWAMWRDHLKRKADSEADEAESDKRWWRGE